MKKRSLHIMLLFIATAALQTTTSAWGMKQASSSSSSASAAAARKTITEKEIVQKWRNDIQLAIQVRNEALPSVAEHLEEPLRAAIDNEDLAALQNELRRAELELGPFAHYTKKDNLYVQAMNYALERNDLGEFAHQFFFGGSFNDEYQIIQKISDDRILHLMLAVLPYNPCLDYQRFFLEKAIRAQDMYAIRALLDKGFKPDYQYDDNPLPLTLAAQTGNADIAFLLRQHGAHLHYAWPSIHEPIKVAAERGNIEMLRALIDSDPIERHHAFRAAINTNNTDLIALLLSDGADPSARLPQSGITPLEAAQPGEAKRLIQEAINKRQATLALCLEHQTLEAGKPVHIETDQRLIDHILQQVNFYLSQQTTPN